MGHDAGCAPCGRGGGRPRPHGGLAADIAEDRRFGLLYAVRRGGQLRLGARGARRGRHRRDRRDSRRFRAFGRHGDAPEGQHLGQRRQRTQGEPRVAVYGADRDADPRRTACGERTGGRARPDRGAEPLQPHARIPFLHDSRADDHAADHDLRVPACAEPRGRKGEGHHRTDQRHPGRPLYLYAGETGALLGDRPRAARVRHAAGMGRLRAGAHGFVRRHLSGGRALHPYDVGHRRGDRQQFRHHAAGDVRDVLLRDALRADERPGDPRRVDARLGAVDHPLPSAPLFRGDHACRLPQGYDVRRIVGRLCRAGRFCVRVRVAGGPDLPQADVTARRVPGIMARPAGRPSCLRSDGDTTWESNLILSDAENEIS